MANPLPTACEAQHRLVRPVLHQFQNPSATMSLSVDPVQLLVLLVLEALVQYVGPLLIYTFVINILTNEDKVFFNQAVPNSHVEYFLVA